SEDREQQLLRGFWIRRALEDHELTRVITGGDFGSGGHHERDVRVLRLPERRRHADDHDVGVLQHGRVCGRLVASLADQREQIVALQIRGARLAGLKGADPVEVRIDADDAVPAAGELDRQREPHIALSDDGNARRAIANACRQTRLAPLATPSRRLVEISFAVSAAWGRSTSTDSEPNNTVLTVSKRMRRSNESERCLM